MSETRKDEMSKRVIRNEPGITEIHLETREVLRDGPMRVECWWSEEDTAYIAQLTDDEPEGRPFTATHTGIGATREEALAHLAVAEYVTAIAVAELPATPPTQGTTGNAPERLDSPDAGAGCGNDPVTAPPTPDRAAVRELAEEVIAEDGDVSVHDTVTLAEYCLALLRPAPLPADVQAALEGIAYRLANRLPPEQFEQVSGIHDELIQVAKSFSAPCDSTGEAR